MAIGPVRRRNRAAVLACLEGEAALTRAEIVQRSGLSKATVLAIVGDLLDEGLATEHQWSAGRNPTLPGRRPTLIGLTRRDHWGVGVDIGNEQVMVALTSGSGQVEVARSERVQVTDGAAHVVRIVARLVRSVVRERGLPADAVGRVVASIPEPMDASGAVARSVVGSRWEHTVPQRLLAEAIHADVRTDNDTNLAVLGEHVYGVGRGIDDLIYVKMSHGVGTGLLVNGQVVRGGNGLAGEIGHTRAREDGMVCRCGNRGCLFTLVSGEYLASRMLATLKDPGDGVRALSRAARGGDPGAGGLLEDAGHDVGIAVGRLCNALNPRTVVLGGMLARSGPWAYRGFAAAIKRSVEPHVYRSLELKRGALEGRTELLGAAAASVGLDQLPALVTSGTDRPEVGGLPRPIGA